MIASGIYKITSIIKPERVYVGSAIDFKRRWSEHRIKLKANKHHSYILQNHYNKYGFDDFSFSILLKVEDINKLIDEEQYYLDILKPYFNVCKVAGKGNQLGNLRTVETCEKISKALSGKNSNNYGKVRYVYPDDCITDKDKKYFRDMKRKTTNTLQYECEGN